MGGALISYWKVATVITFGLSGLPLALTIVTGKVMLYLLGYLVAVIAGFLFTGWQDSTTQRSKVWLITSVVLSFSTGWNAASAGYVWHVYALPAAATAPERTARLTFVTRDWPCAAGERPGSALANEPAALGLYLWPVKPGSNSLSKTLRTGFDHVTAFPVVQARLTSYLDANDADIWLITGSPQSLVEQVYFDTPWLPRVNLIATQISWLRRVGIEHALSGA